MAASTSSLVKRGVMCWGQFQSNASTEIRMARSTFARYPGTVKLAAKAGSSDASTTLALPQTFRRR